MIKGKILNGQWKPYRFSWTETRSSRLLLELWHVPFYHLVHLCLRNFFTIYVYWFAHLFSRGHATLHLGPSVGRSVGRSVGHILELRAVFALLLLPNRPRLDCRVSGLVCLWCLFLLRSSFSQWAFTAKMK